MTSPRGLASSTLLALALAAASAAFALRAIRYEPPLRSLQGVFAPADAPLARSLVERLSSGLIALQRPDGGFDLGAEGEYAYLIERVASSALATAALAKVRTLAPHVRVQGLDEALARGLDYVKTQQIETGAIGREELKDRWSQVDATTAAVLAFALSGRPQDEEALFAAAAALKRFARAGLRNGWTRAFGIMTVDRVASVGRADVFDGSPRSLADIRDLKQAREGPPQTSDWNVAEGIARVVLGLRKGADPFPGRLVRAILYDPPVWSGQSADCQAFWMQAWLVARSGSPQARAWFRALAQALAEEAVQEDGTIHGGWYANTLSQTAGATLALVEGLSSQVVVIEGLEGEDRESGNSGGR